MNTIKIFLRKHPIVRGMTVYSILYPASNATQQYFSQDRDRVDVKECFRFAILGTFFVAPSLFGWVKLASIIVKGNSLKHCLIKAYVEQFTYAPFAYTQFFIGINALEGKSLKECCNKLKSKFWSAWKVGFCVWPVIQTVNFKFLSERNRVPFIAVCSFSWNVFLSYLHHRSTASSNNNTNECKSG